MFETLLALPVASVNVLAATETLAAPSADTVQDEPYTVVEVVVKVSPVHPVAVRSTSANVVVDSLLV